MCDKLFDIGMHARIISVIAMFMYLVYNVS